MVGSITVLLLSHRLFPNDVLESNKRSMHNYHQNASKVTFLGDIENFVFLGDIEYTVKIIEGKKTFVLTELEIEF